MQTAAVANANRKRARERDRQTDIQTDRHYLHLGLVEEAGHGQP